MPFERVEKPFDQMAPLKCKTCGCPLSIGRVKDDGRWVLFCSNLTKCHPSPFMFNADLQELILEYFRVGAEGLPPIYELRSGYDYFKEAKQ